MTNINSKTESEGNIPTFAESLSQLCRLLVEEIVPNLKRIQENQTDQRQQSEWLTQNIEEFRLEMQQRFAELHAELAASRVQIEDAIVIIREQKAANSEGRKILIN